MKCNFRPALLLVMLLNTTPVLAGPRQREKVEKPHPPAELATLKFFLGTWQCKGNLHAMPGRPEGPFTAVAKIKLELDGHWASVSYDQSKTKQNPTPVNARFWYGYDAKKKHYVSTYLNNYGARGHLISPGWQGDKWIDQGHLEDRFGEMMKMRMTSTKLATRKFRVVVEVLGPDGWLPINEGVCSR